MPALLGDGTRINKNEPVPITALGDVTAIVGGGYHSLAVKRNRSVWGMGKNQFGGLGDGSASTSDTPVQVSGFGDATAVAAGWYHSVALKAVGTVWAWGYNYDGQLGDGTTTNSSTPVQVSPLAGVAYQPPALGGAITAAERRGQHNASERHCVCTARFAADPVDVATGTFSQTFSDISVAGRGYPLHFSRTYNSDAAASDGPLGFGWTHSYDVSLDVDATTGAVTVAQENGAAVTFTPSGASYSAPPRVTATLVHNIDGTYTLTRQATQKLVFSAAGALVRLVDLNGYATTLSYEPTTGFLASIADTGGRTLTLAYAASRIQSVSDFIGRKVEYSYDGAGNLTGVTNIGGFRSGFGYDAAHRLTTMRSARYFGDTTTTPTPVTTNHYDPQGRVDHQTDPLGRTTLFDYTSVADATKVTDPKGNAVLYRFSNGFSVSETRGYGTNAAATWSYGYDPATLGVTRVTDPNGHSTVSSYDASGNLLSRRDPLGRQTSWTYNALNQPETITDPTGVATTYTYDTTGNPTSESRPLLNAAGSTVATRTTTYTHGDPAHPEDVTTLVGPLGKPWTATYDSAGNRLSVSDPLAHKTTSRYDALGNVTSTVAARGNVAGANPEQHRIAMNYDEFGQALWSANELSAAIVDGFTRPDSTGPGSTETGLAWQTMSGAWAINSSKLPWPPRPAAVPPWSWRPPTAMVCSALPSPLLKAATASPLEFRMSPTTGACGPLRAAGTS